MIRVNEGYLSLTPSFFFTKIGEEIAAYENRHPDKRLLYLGVGDVTKPLAPAVIEAMHRAVSEQGEAASFHGYQPETGTDFLKEAVVSYYAKRNVALSTEEVLISSGAADDRIVSVLKRHNEFMTSAHLCSLFHFFIRRGHPAFPDILSDRFIEEIVVL